ncbi:ATP-binding cassette domain-containing protein [Spongiimicrobium salis]|uniref:ATP-binding cassette domain-containing protein n=1 Tax=Spongiimicrobium salis TaxID=1667022 RepID=UPI00374DF8DD
MRESVYQHWGIFVDGNTDIPLLIDRLLKKRFSGIDFPKKIKGSVYAPSEIHRYLRQERRHGENSIAPGQNLGSLSSGEQKKALLAYLAKEKSDFIIFFQAFEHLDAPSREILTTQLDVLRQECTIVQLILRKKETFPFLQDFITLKGNALVEKHHLCCPLHLPSTHQQPLETAIPRIVQALPYALPYLVEFHQVSVSYDHRPILNAIDWQIGPNEFWQLTGENGSGKTTILSLIYGENPKAYGQNITLFGKRKGSGESIWDIKEKIGYYSPGMILQFPKWQTAEQVLLSGLYDSLGLYYQPKDTDHARIRTWMEQLKIEALKDVPFHEINEVQQRMLLTVRAMVKQPLLLILDEPLAGLNDENITVFISLVNTIAKQTTTSIIFVSHTQEQALETNGIYELRKTPKGSKGIVITSPSKG